MWERATRPLALKRQTESTSHPTTAIDIPLDSQPTPPEQDSPRCIKFPSEGSHRHEEYGRRIHPARHGLRAHLEYLILRIDHVETGQSPACFSGATHLRGRVARAHTVLAYFFTECTAT